MKPTILTAMLLAAGLACASTAFAGVANANVTLVQDVRVFDGKAAHEHRSVLVRDGVIADADFHGKAPAGARVVEGSGRTLLPGLIDAHVHTWQHFELPLVFGVTTQVDMFTGVEVMQRIKQQMAEGRNGREADVFSAGTLVTARAVTAPNSRSRSRPWKRAATPRLLWTPASPRARTSSKS